MAAVVTFGPVCAHAVSMSEAIDLIARQAASGAGGFVLTPNVDHIAIARADAGLATAYQRAFLCLADGMPLVALSRLLGLPLREKVSGSDVFEPLMARCAQDRLPVFFMGATEETCEHAIRKLRESYPDLEVLGYDSSLFDLEMDPEAARLALRRAGASGARLVMVFLPPRKQVVLSLFEDEYRPAVGFGAGSSLAFYVGATRRAPVLVSRLGLEWLFRLVQEPRRLWRRYLVEDLAAIPVFARLALERLSNAIRGRNLPPSERRPN